MEEKTKRALPEPFFVEDFKARGEIYIDDNLLSYDAQNGVLSLRIIKRKDTNKAIIEKLNNKWILFDEYFDVENGTSEDDISHTFCALLSYGYLDGYTICFYINRIIQNNQKSPFSRIEIFSECLIEHFYNAEDFDYRTIGFVEDDPCAEMNISGINFRVYKSVAVRFAQNKTSFSFKFPKQYIGGFVFQADNNKAIPTEVVHTIVSGVNSYCNFILCDSGNFICNVELVNDNDSMRGNNYYIEKPKALVTELKFKQNVMLPVFDKLLKMFLVDNCDFSNLYTLESNTYKILDILRVTSMFENAYRENLQHGLRDYVKKEEDYKEAYDKVIEIKIKGDLTDLEKSIVQSEKMKRKFLTTSLRSRLRFIFEKMLMCFNKTRKDLSDSIIVRFTGYNVTELADRITDARNDIAHFLKKEIDYQGALRDVYVLQMMIYYMIFERVDLSIDRMQEVLLGDSRRIRKLFNVE